jgi:hypothetical protein
MVCKGRPPNSDIVCAVSERSSPPNQNIKYRPWGVIFSRLGMKGLDGKRCIPNVHKFLYRARWYLKFDALIENIRDAHLRTRSHFALP